ncbi:MAG TPA: ethanolamine ammonia-lyase subunit EutB, partial [Gemmiger qucibialis]|nr:ethanolamine ammonia-lyase subunit EutB [Gemmiger qucibialis]
ASPARSGDYLAGLAAATYEERMAAKLALADVFRTRGSVLAEEYRENGVYYKATVKVDDLHRFEAYLL